MPARPPSHVIPETCRDSSSGSLGARAPDVSGCPGRHSRGLWTASRLLASRRLELGPQSRRRHCDSPLGAGAALSSVVVSDPGMVSSVLPEAGPRAGCIRAPAAGSGPASAVLTRSHIPDRDTRDTPAPERPPPVPSSCWGTRLSRGASQAPLWTQHFLHLLDAVVSPTAHPKQDPDFSRCLLCLFQGCVQKARGNGSFQHRILYLNFSLTVCEGQAQPPSRGLEGSVFLEQNLVPGRRPQAAQLLVNEADQEQ